MLAQKVRRHNLIPVVEGMSPEMGVPGVVYSLQGAVFVSQPGAKGILAVCAVAGSAVFIADMPGHNVRLSLIVLRQTGCQLRREMPEGIAARAGVVAAAELPLHPGEFRAQNLRVAPGHPGRMCAGGCRHTDVHAGLCDPLHCFIQLRKVVVFLRRLDHGPVKDVQRHNVHARFMQILHVLFTGIRIPLLRIIISAVQHLRYV